MNYLSSPTVYSLPNYVNGIGVCMVTLNWPIKAQYWEVCLSPCLSCSPTLTFIGVKLCEASRHGSHKIILPFHFAGENN